MRILLLILLLSLLFSCKNSSEKCKPVEEWSVKNYRIVKMECPDMVLASFFRYDIYNGANLERNGVSRTDSCMFTWQPSNESYLKLNVCTNTVEELKHRKNLLNLDDIDSVIIYSDGLDETQFLTSKQIKKLVKDFNTSKTRGYSQDPFDSSFDRVIPYQYKLTVFSKGKKRYFYGYNYLMLDSSNWEYEMSKTGDINYFHNYWKK
jgi:hypothetical protein